MFDDAGIRYQAHGVTGVAYCQGPLTFRLCVGVPRMDQAIFFPLQGYTDIEPGKSVTVHYDLNGGAPAANSQGSFYSLAQDIAYRFADFDKDGAMSDAEKMKSLHFGALSFTGAKPLKPDVDSSVKFDQVK